MAFKDADDHTDFRTPAGWCRSSDAQPVSLVPLRAQCGTGFSSMILTLRRMFRMFRFVGLVASPDAWVWVGTINSTPPPAFIPSLYNFYLFKEKQAEHVRSASGTWVLVFLLSGTKRNKRNIVCFIGTPLALLCDGAGHWRPGGLPRKGAVRPLCPAPPWLEPSALFSLLFRRVSGWRSPSRPRPARTGLRWLGL
jgi:hypothetical protein